MSNDVHLEVDFTLNNTSLEGNFTANTQPDIQADFIIETGRVQADFKDITGDPYNNSALAEALNLKADTSTIEELSENVDLKLSALGTKFENDINALEVEIDNLTTVVGDNYNSLDGKIDSTATALVNGISALETDLNDKIDEEQSARIEADNALQGNIDTLDNKIDTHIADKTNPHEVTKAQVGLGNVDNTSDLDKPISTATQTALNGKQNTISDLSEIRSNASNGQSAYNTIQNYGDIVTYDASSFATNLQGQKADTALQPNDDITKLNNNAGYITSADVPTVNNSTITFQKNNVTVGDINLNQPNNETINFNIPTTASDVNALPDTTTIENLTTTAQQNAINSGATSDNIGQIATNTSNLNSLQTTVTNNYNTLDGRITSEVSALNTAIGAETTNRQNADNNLQSQIDAIVSSSDVFDIVGTYAELQAYDISTVPVNDIIKVLVDSTHSNAATYYRCVESGGVKSWLYIGSEGAYYTKSESDSLFVEKTTTVNGKALSNNITLNATDVGALPSSTTIGNGILTIQNNGVDVDSFSANATSNKSINLVTPTKTSDLVNDSGFIDNSGLSNYATQTDLTNGLATKQDTISDLSTIRQNAQNGQSAYTTIQGYGDIVTYNASNFATSAQGSLADTALQQGDNISLLNNNAGFISGIDSTDVITALGYTPYNSTNPNGYTSNIGTVTSVNNTSPDSNGNVTISIPSISNLANKDLSNLSTTGNAKFQAPLVSGTNIKTLNNQSLLGSGNITISSAGANTDLSNLTATGEAHFLKNTATATVKPSITILGTATSARECLNIGYNSVVSGVGSLAIGTGGDATRGAQATGANSVAVGTGAKATEVLATAIGTFAEATATKAIQIGSGTNSTAQTLQIGFYTGYNYTLLDGTTGLIPDDRLSTNIARTSQIPTESTVSGWGFTKNVGTVTDVKVNNTSVTSSGVANIPLSGTDTLGVAKANAAYGVYNNSGTLTISKATDSQVTAKTSQYRPLVPYNIDLAVKTGVTTNSLTLTSAEQTAAQNWLGVANADLRNLSATGQKVIDGQWVCANNVIISDATGATSTDCTSQLKSIIGNDNYCYDLLIRTWVDYKSATANLSITTEFVDCVVNRATSGGGQRPILNLIPVGADKSFTVTRSAVFNTCSIMLVAYRRIGTNS